jgi:hypothetical protein
MNDHLKDLKTSAKAIARARRISHVGALEIVAASLGYPHWNALTAAEKSGWRPSEDDVLSIRALAIAENPLFGIEIPPEIALGDPRPSGEVMGHGYRVSVKFDDVRVWGRGWELVLLEAPLAPARYTNTAPEWVDNPYGDDAFKAAIHEIAKGWQQMVHARIASDWPRRSTVPDGDGNAQHPLTRDVGKTWYCLHCDGVSDALAITDNLFHCPHCLASPIDIFSSPWWIAGVGEGAGRM